MKKCFAFLLLGLAACQHQPTPVATDQVNALVGNAGYVAATGYAVGSAAWGGLNIALGAINASQLNLARPDRGPVYLGVLSGAGQILFGALHLPKDEPGGSYIGWNPPAVKSYASERTVSYLNIGAGTATLGLSAWNLLRRQPAGASRTAVGVVNFPGPAGGTGLALTRRF